MNDSNSLRTEVLVVGGGPSGASAAYWLAMRGFQVTVLERKSFPREKTCGDGLTPRSVVQLEEMGLHDFLQDQHLFWGLRAVGYGKSLEIPWPTHPDYPDYGYIVRRSILDKAVLDRAQEVGATVLTHHEATALVHQDGVISRVEVANKDNDSHLVVVPDFVVLCEGSNSRLSRSLGAVRNVREPLGLALRSYYATPRSQEPWIESHMDLRNKEGAVFPGYGWIFPMGDGTANVGFGLLSNRNRWRRVNTTIELQRFLTRTSAQWDFSDALVPPTGGKLPMGFTVAPLAGKNYLLAGDAAASINPFNGEGISYGYETGRMAAHAITLALTTKSSAPLARYPDQLSRHYAGYYLVARTFVKIISEPRAMHAGVWLSMRSKHTMAPIVTAMANLMSGTTPQRLEHLYRFTNATKERLAGAAGRHSLIGNDTAYP